jgi:carbon-monoxide dehydrogenase medium subunit
MSTPVPEATRTARVAFPRPFVLFWAIVSHLVARPCCLVVHGSGVAPLEQDERDSAPLNVIRSGGRSLLELPMRFLHVRSLDVALAELGRRGDELVVLAGGTDLMVQVHKGDVRPAGWLSIGALSSLSGTRVEPSPHGQRLVIGALVSHHRLALDPQVRQAVPALAAAAATVGGWQTQEAGTLGGNVCNASPAADTLPPLLVADAQVTLGSARGRRTMPLSDFVVGRRSTLRAPDELLIALTATPLPDRAAETYLKVGPRSAMEVALVGLAVRLQLTPTGRVTDARIAVGSVAPVAFRAHEAERVLVGSQLEAEAVAEAGAILAAAARPVDDARASAAYRRRILPPLLARAVHQCRSQIPGS